MHPKQSFMDPLLRSQNNSAWNYTLLCLTLLVKVAEAVESKSERASPSPPPSPVAARQPARQSRHRNGYHVPRALTPPSRYRGDRTPPRTPPRRRRDSPPDSTEESTSGRQTPTLPRLVLDPPSPIRLRTVSVHRRRSSPPPPQDNPPDYPVAGLNMPPMEPQPNRPSSADLAAES